MAYVPSMREIPLDQEPHKSVLDTLMPDPFAESYEPVDLSEATDAQKAHLDQCMRCRQELGLFGPGSGEL